MYGGAAGLRKGGKEEGARKGGGRDTEERTKEEKKREKTGYCWGEAEGENFKKGEEGNGEAT